MENKKGAHANSVNTPNINEALINEAVPKHVHQHNTAPQHLRILQYSLNIPTQLNQASPHQHQPPPVTSHVHQHLHQTPGYQPSPHQHLQLQHQHQPNTPTIYQNQVIHYHQRQQPQKNQNHFHYQSNQVVALTSPNLNQLNQQNAHIWTPHQPGHYHPQQESQNKPEPQIQAHPLPHKDVERKKSAGSNQQLRSPSAKRPPEAPVAIQGWLHKQGSEGLMLWKKRWFVLSEYCLFYYKGPEEEKLLGSILLPSYKVSVCSPEDKVNRKWAFKCEHANMRTYILAADSQELMIQWVRLLNMACLLQSTIEMEQEKKSVNKLIESSSVKQKPSPQIQNVRSTPVHMYTSSNTTDLSNPSQHELGQYSQPLYANAPPKPRRLTDGYSSPSSEMLDRYSADSKYMVYQQPYQARPLTKSPINVYGNPQALNEYVVQQPLYNKHLHLSEYGTVMLRDNHSVERRTPDTYGRSKQNPKGSHPSDYEDVYADRSVYKRPLSPLAYNSNSNSNPVPALALVRSPMAAKDAIPHQPSKAPNTIPRPHSADFLDYEIKHHHNLSTLAKQPRPKSSLDINRNSSNDNYFYSEERYAEKMRKSVQYLPKMAKYQQEYPAQQRWPGSSYKPEPENTFPVVRSNGRPVNFNEANVHSFYLRDPQPIRSRSVLSDGSLCKEVDMDLQSSHYDKDPSNPAFRTRPKDMYHGYSADYDHFTRSASARLAQNTNPFEERGVNQEGERKREESMKRLLEWKQRMLQSPLNRKANQNYRGIPGKMNAYQRSHENRNVVMYRESRKPTNSLPQYNSYSSDDEASGSISINTRDTFPRTTAAKKVWPANTKSVPSKSTINIAKPYGIEHASRRSQPVYLKPQSQQDLSSDTSQSSSIRKANWQLGEKVNLSAGELLGRTHEELVLLLIQLRRQSANTSNAIEACYSEIDSIQTKLPKMDAAKRLENLHKLEQIKQHLLELEKQYEKGKPLVNLVDNMVKLGSLYRFPKDHNNYSYVKDRLEFNQHIQERRLLAEERRDWSRLSPNHTELQAKVQQLYQLDHLIQEESEMLQGLQHDKEEIERALGGLRYRLIKGFKNPAEVEQARKQQIMLENELSRVHSMLAQNSRKLEETVAGNARLEQELLVLKQKLQISKQQRSSPQISNAGDSLPCVIGTSAMLESDLHRVQQKVGDLQRQRQELSMQVRQLTDRSSSNQQSRPSSTTPVQVNHASAKKKVNLLWRETDLDTMNSIDHGEIWDNRIGSPSPKQSHDFEIYDQNYKHGDSGSEYDTFQNQSAVPQEKQEIKTVRIVKRESERRQRDREKTATGKWDAVIEEEDSSQNSSVLFRPMPILKTQSSNNLETLSPTEEDKSNGSVLNRHSSISNPNLPQVYTDSRNVSSSVEGSLNKSPELSPIFKSEAARQIIIEMSSHDVPKQSNRRAVPKEKRRHYTAPHNNLIMKSLNQLPTDSKDFDKLDINNVRRARDDLDMERALRQRIDAPDVVRSTLSNKELKYNESTIDNILGTPNKIFIPERYVPEQLPQLSAEEQQQRLRKVESIKKMLSDTTIISGSSANLVSEEANPDNTSTGVTNKATSKMIEEKKQREHLLQLNQILAKQVMEMSKIVAVKALASLPLESDKLCSDEDDVSSPETPLPIYQQRDNFYS